MSSVRQRTNFTPGRERLVGGVVLPIDVERAARAVLDGRIVEYQAVALLGNAWRRIDRANHRRCIRSAMEGFR